MLLHEDNTNDVIGKVIIYSYLPDGGLDIKHGMLRRQTCIYIETTNDFVYLR